MYFKIFYTFMILFVISNLAVDLYGLYNTGKWEPFGNIIEGATGSRNTCKKRGCEMPKKVGRECQLDKVGPDKFVVLCPYGCRNPNIGQRNSKYCKNNDECQSCGAKIFEADKFKNQLKWMKDNPLTGLKNAPWNTKEKSPQDQAQEWKQVALEGQTAKCNGLVRFGANDKWVVKHSLGNLPCTQQVFGKHLPGVSKSCECKISDWTKDDRTELVTQKLMTNETGLCLPEKGGLVTYQGKACGRNKNDIQWTKINVDPDQVQKQFQKTGCNFQVEEDEILIEYEKPSIARGNLIKSQFILPFAYSIEFDYTPTGVASEEGWENIFRITDNKERSADSFKDRLVGAFKRKNSTKLQIIIGTVNKTHTIDLKKNFRRGRTYNIRIEVRNKEAEIFVSGSLNHTEIITAKRDIINDCNLYFSDQHYESAKCVIENFNMKRLGSDPDWVSRYFGGCGKGPTIQNKQRGIKLNTKISELLRYDQSGKSQSIEWEAISKKKEHKHIPQPKPIARLTPEYIPYLDDNNRDWIPNWINIDNPAEDEEVKLGRYFTRGVKNLRGLNLPTIYDSEYQLIGKTVLRAEKSRRRGAKNPELLKQKETIAKIFDGLLGLDSDSYNGNVNNKRKHAEYTGVPAYSQPDQTVKNQTSNMFSDNSNKDHVDTNKNTYTTKYRPRDPSLYPRPVDGIWSLISGQ